MTIEAKDYNQECDNDNREILQQLAQASDSDDVISVISSYTIGQPDNEIRKKLDKLLLPPLKDAAAYLGLTVDGEKLKYKKDIITAIIQRIETLLRDLCGVCGEYYNNKITDEPNFKCLICQQGCHQPCFDEMNTLLKDTKGEAKNAFHFICTRCYSNYDSATTTKEKSTPTKKGATTPAQQQQHAPQPPDDQQSHPKPPAIQQQQPNEHNLPQPTVDQPSHPPLSAPQQNPHQAPPIQQNQQEVRPQICNKYRRRECPHGASGKNLIDGKQCEYSHPRRCRRYCHNGTHPKFGCTKPDCEQLHPKLCKYSQRNRVCTNLDCKFTHLKFTRRYDPFQSAEVNTNTNSSSYYNPQRQHQPAYYPQQQTNQQYHQPYADAMHQPQPTQQTTQPQQADMGFLMKFVQHVKDELQNQKAQMMEINQRLVNKPSNPAPQIPVMQPVTQFIRPQQPAQPIFQQQPRMPTQQQLFIPHPHV